MNLSKAKIGDKFVTRSGKIVSLTGNIPGTMYPYRFGDDTNDFLFSTTSYGFVYLSNTESPDDIESKVMYVLPAKKKSKQLKQSQLDLQILEIIL